MYYTKEGYIDVEKTLAKDPSTFIFMVGARGIGKTFGFLKYLIDNHQVVQGIHIEIINILNNHLDKSLIRKLLFNLK